MTPMIQRSVDTTEASLSVVFPQPAYAPSLFTGHDLRSVAPPSPVQHPTGPWWIPAILIAAFILIAWTRFFYPGRLRQIFRAPFSQRFVNQLVRDGNLFSERIALALGTVYLISFSLFIYLLAGRFQWPVVPGVPGIYLFAGILLMTAAYLAAKVTLMILLGIIFRTRESTAAYLLNMLLFTLVSGPLLLIFLIPAVYLRHDFFLFFGAAAVGILAIMRFLRGFFIGMGLRKFSYLFLFVYLCSLEILPLLVILKVLLNLSVTMGV